MKTSALLAVIGVALVGCGAETVTEERQLPEIVGGKADIPTWLRHIPVDFDCGAELKDGFVGADSAHMYSFPATAGVTATFAFEADYKKSRGAAIAVYDAETGDRLAVDRHVRGTKAEVAFEPTKSGKVLVAVYSVAWTATGAYTLSAACETPSIPGTIVSGADRFIAATDGMECKISSVHCVTTDWTRCPQISPLPPGWCADGRAVRGEDRFVDSSDGKQCSLPSHHCVTNDANACPMLTRLGPDFCPNGTVVRGPDSFFPSTDGLECQRPSFHCVTNDWSACPLFQPLPPNFCQ